MCSFKLLYFVIFILNVYKTHTEISDKRLCVDSECKEPISTAKTLVRYNSPDANILSFKPNDDAIIYSKSAGSLTTLWGAEIAGKRGYIPKDFVREIKILNVPKVLVDTELTNDSTTPKVPTKDSESVKPDKVQQPYEVVDGTTIYLDSPNIAASTTESPVTSTIASTLQTESESNNGSPDNKKPVKDSSDNSHENGQTFVNSSLNESQNSSSSISMNTPDILQSKTDKDSKTSDSKEDTKTKSSDKTLLAQEMLNEKILDEENKSKRNTEPSENKNSGEKIQNTESVSNKETLTDIDTEPNKEDQKDEGFDIFSTLSNFISPNNEDKKIDANKDENNSESDDEEDDIDDDEDDDYDDEVHEEEEIADETVVLGKNISQDWMQRINEDSSKNIKKEELTNIQETPGNKTEAEESKKEEESPERNVESQGSRSNEKIKDIIEGRNKLSKPEDTLEKKIEATHDNDATNIEDTQDQGLSSDNKVQEQANLNSQNLNTESQSNGTKDITEKSNDLKSKEPQTAAEIKFNDTQDYQKSDIQISNLPAESDNANKKVDETVQDSSKQLSLDEISSDPIQKDNENTIALSDSSKDISSNEGKKHLESSSDAKNVKPPLPPLSLFMDTSQFSQDPSRTDKLQVDSTVDPSEGTEVTPSPSVTDIPFEIPKPLEIESEEVTLNPLDSLEEPKDKSLKSLHQIYQAVNEEDAKINVIEVNNNVLEPKQMEQDQEKSPETGTGEGKTEDDKVSPPEALIEQGDKVEYAVPDHTHNVIDMLKENSEESKNEAETKQFSQSDFVIGDQEAENMNLSKEKLTLGQKNEIPSVSEDHIQNQNYDSGEINPQEKPAQVDSKIIESKSQSIEVDNSNSESEFISMPVEDDTTDDLDENQKQCFGILGYCIYNYGSEESENEENINANSEEAENNRVVDEQLQSEAFIYQNAGNSDSYCDADPASSYCKLTKQDAHETYQEKSILEMDLSVFTSDMFIYLVTTAVSVIFFLLGYILIDRSRREGPLVAKINKLEKEYLIMLKENSILREKVEGTTIDNLINTVPNEVMDELKQQLDEMAATKLTLEEQILSLEKELENSTEVGMELNKMLSDILSSQNGSESLMANIEQLQRQLVEQQSTINSINETLSIKDTENHELHLELDISNKKVLELQSELDKLLLNILKIEEEKDLQQSALEAQVNLYKLKYEEISTSLSNREEAFNNEIQTLKLKLSETQRNLELKTKEYDLLKDTIRSAKNAKNNPEALKSLIDASALKAELEQVKSENQNYVGRLQQQEENRFNLEKKLQSLLEDNSKLKERYDEADKEKVEAQMKLEVLSIYFKEKETQLQKELSKHESIWMEKQGEATSTIERIKYMQEELQNCKSQNEALKQEILAQEVELKSKISVLEKKVNENWVSARQAERRLEDAKQEAAQLRNRLTMRERALNEEKAQNRMQSPMDQNGDLPLSPLHIESPASPPLLYGGRDHITKSPPLPGLPPFLPPPPPFMPPPLTGVPPFMPPPPSMYPGDHRPPPLGRMSSPPLNSRYSPDSRDYSPYDRNSPSPTYDSEYSPSSPPPIGGFSPYNSREDRRDYKRPPPQMPPHMRTNGRNAKGPTHSSGGSGNSNESLDRINQHSKV